MAEEEPTTPLEYVIIGAKVRRDDIILQRGSPA